MTVKEAREIIRTEIGRQNQALCPEDREFMKAIGYLAALEGPEVKALVEALESIGGFGCVNAQARVGKPCGICFSCEAREALKKIKEKS